MLSLVDLGHLVEQVSTPGGELIRAQFCSGVNLRRGAAGRWALILKGHA